MSIGYVFLTLLVILCANIVETITGFAGTLLAMPFVMLFLGIDNAKVVMNMAALFIGTAVFLQNYRYTNWKELRKILLFMIAGLFLGMKLYLLFSPDLLLPSYGIMIILIASKKMICKDKEGELSSFAGGVVLLLSGLIHGMFVSGGALLVIYAARALRDKNEFRATLAPVWIVLNTILLAQQITEGLYSRENVIVILLVIVPLIIANFIGNKIQCRVGQEQFLKLTYILLIISGGSILL